MAKPLCDVLGKEVKMGPVQLAPEVQEVVRVLMERIQTASVLVFPDFDKPFLLETDASKEGLRVVLSQKHDDSHLWKLFPDTSRKELSQSQAGVPCA